MPILTGCATQLTDADYEQMAQRYRPACERAGFVADLDLARCVGASAGYIPSNSPETLEQRLMRQYGERCQLAGYKPRTGAFGQCLLAYAERDQANRQALAAAYLMSQHQGISMPPQIQMPTYGQTTCTSIVAGNIVQTTCR